MGIRFNECGQTKADRTAVAMIILLLAIAARSHAGVVYSFAHIADVSKNYPAINNNGLVAFEGRFSNGGGGVYIGSGGPLTFIGPGVPGGIFGVWINDASQVAFKNNPSLGVFSIARGSGGALTSIRTFGPGEGSTFLPVINDAGTTTYLSPSTGIFSGNGGSLTTVLSISGTNSTQYNSPFEGLAVSHNGTLAYEKYASSSSVEQSHIIVNRGGIETVILTSSLTAAALKRSLAPSMASKAYRLITLERS